LGTRIKSHKWYHQEPTEFEVQLVAFNKLQEALGKLFIIRGEYYYSQDPKHERIPLSNKAVRLDIAIFTKFHLKTPPKLILTIEIKRNFSKMETAQGKKYEMFLGVPCIYIRGMLEAENIVDIILPHLSKILG